MYGLCQIGVMELVNEHHVDRWTRFHTDSLKMVLSHLTYTLVTSQESLNQGYLSEMILIAVGKEGLGNSYDRKT